MKTFIRSLEIQFIIFAVLVPAVFASVPSPLFTNGSFENGLSGWTVTGNAGIRSTAPYAAAAGTRLVAFNAGNKAADGVVWRTFPTTKGRIYRVDFATGILSYQNGSQTIGVKVNGGTSLLSRSISIPGMSGGMAAWVLQSLHFTADQSSATLEFRDLSRETNGIDLLLDEVVVTPMNVHTLTAESWLYPGVSVAVQPPDLSGIAGGKTGWNRHYEHGTKISLSVPASVIHVPAPYKSQTMRFREWQLDGLHYDFNRETKLILNADHVMVPVYAMGPPIITMEPEDQTVRLGETATFSVTVDAPDTHYQWRYNGVLIEGAYSSTLTIPSARAGDAGSYDVMIGDFGGSVTSRPAVLRVIAPPFANGGFENGSEGWTATGNVRFISAPLYPATEGKTVANFNAGNSKPDGVLSQTFSTVPGRRYLLTMDAGIISFVRQWQKMEIHISGSQAGPWQFSEPGSGAGKVEWYPLSIPFTAHENPTVIEFRDTSDVTQSIDLLLDNVRLLEVPPDDVLVFPGTFAMGSPVDEPGRGMFEQSHSVSLANHLLVKATEVTWAEWTSTRSQAQARGYTDLAVGRNGLNGGPLGDHPVTTVSWWDAIKWCNLRSEIEGIEPAYYSAPTFTAASILRRGTPAPYVKWNADGYRLPTEAEWEYFCRAGSTTAFFNGQPVSNIGSLVDTTLEPAGWYGGNSGGNSQPVAMKIPNPWGLYDTHGGVYEWCWDWFGFYPAGPVIDPTGAATGSDRVIRGGAWNVESRQCRSAFRHSSFPNHSLDFVGFRPVRTVRK